MVWLSGVRWWKFSTKTVRRTLLATIPMMKLKYVPAEKDISLSTTKELSGVYRPTKGTASLVIGISSETIFIKTVRDSITVTPK